MKDSTPNSNKMLLVLGLLISTTAAWGTSIPISTTGDVQIGTLAGSLVPGAQEDQLQASIMLEQSGLSLGSNLAVDASVAGVYNAATNLTPGFIAAGTVFSDWYFHADPVAASGTRFAGTITFTQNILGVISRSTSLIASDSLLGQPTVVYAGADPARGFELSSSQDQFAISDDLRTLTFSAMTWGNVDDLRILTGSPSPAGAFQTSEQQITPAPEPATFLILGIGLVGISLVRKKR